MSAPVGIVGFGEAGRSIAAGLAGAAGATVVVYDIRAADPAAADALAAEARAIGVTLAPDPAALAAGAQVILSLATVTGAVPAARSLAPHLHPGHTYVDLNSTSPAIAQEVGEVVAATGATFVDGAIMAAVPGHGHRVPVLLAGPAADPAAALAELGMDVQVVSEVVGAASAVKMFRSLLVKGIEALVLETVLAASRWDADGAVLASMADALPSDDWVEIAGYFTGRTALHGERRSHEMHEVARTVRECGLDPLMATAAAERIGWAAALGLSAATLPGPIGDHRAVVAALRAAGAFRDDPTAE